MKNDSRRGFTRLVSPSSTHDAIAARAYALWVRRGYPENQAEVIWLAAERELAAAPGKSPRVPSLGTNSF